MDTDPIHSADHDPDGYALIGACYEVHKELGNGYLEDVYQESLELELTDRSIPFVAQPKLPIFYKGLPLRKHYEADLLVLDNIIVELKAVKALLLEHEAQLLHYLKATSRRVGYLVNFGAFPKLDWRRRIR
ncbi:GxxExxY protein [Nibricoccus aquaticus]|uniref:GxxExxY protein n=1 Tax=Nibricoccus aquaticus TaxID=2576891 RepID=A0A290QKH5_9BACT|nr:GxxExxY protein [Nibricoccus aquaticus]ATC65848.1 GxxExxY protein [Nibricoccus aquaticus]